MSIIAIDYGKSKCGYATGSIFVAKSGTIKTSELFKQIQPFTIVILGLPLSMSGNYSSQTFEVVRLALKLKEMKKEVLLIDERLTTKMAKTYEKKEDDRFSAEQLLLEYIQSPQRAIPLKKCVIEDIEKRILNGNSVLNALIDSDFAILIDVPYHNYFKIKNGIGLSNNPYSAYTIFTNGFFVYRVMKDFVERITSMISELNRMPDYIIINKTSRRMLSDLLDFKDYEHIKALSMLLNDGKVKIQEFSVHCSA
ncbi:MAG: Holliday junction resolvase RuvX [Fervidobacterium sp.]